MEAKYFVSRKGRYFIKCHSIALKAVILHAHYQGRVTNNCGDSRRPDFREGGGGTNSTAVHPGNADFFLEQPLSTCVASGRASDLQLT